MKALADAIGLRVPGFGSGVVNIVDCPEQLEVVAISPATIPFPDP